MDLQKTNLVQCLDGTRCRRADRIYMLMESSYIALLQKKKKKALEVKIKIRAYNIAFMRNGIQED